MAIFVRAFFVMTILALALSAPTDRREGKGMKRDPVVISQYSSVARNRNFNNKNSTLPDALDAKKDNTEQAAVPVPEADPVPEQSHPDAAPAQIAEAPVDAVKVAADAESLTNLPTLVQAPDSEVKPNEKLEVTQDSPKTEPESLPVAVEPKQEQAEVLLPAHDDNTNKEAAVQPLIETLSEVSQPEEKETTSEEIREEPSSPILQEVPEQPKQTENLAEPTSTLTAIANNDEIQERVAEVAPADVVASDTVNSDAALTTNDETTEVPHGETTIAVAQETNEFVTEEPVKQEPLNLAPSTEGESKQEPVPASPATEQNDNAAIVQDVNVDEVPAASEQGDNTVATAPVVEAEAIRNVEDTPKEAGAPVPVTGNFEDLFADIQEVAQPAAAPSADAEVNQGSQESNESTDVRSVHFEESHADDDDASKEADTEKATSDKLSRKPEKLERSKLGKDKSSKSPKSDDFEERRKRELFA